MYTTDWVLPGCTACGGWGDFDLGRIGDLDLGRRDGESDRERERERERERLLPLFTFLLLDCTLFVNGSGLGPGAMSSGICVGCLMGDNTAAND